MNPLDPGETGELGGELVRLGSADNFRDVAGPGYRGGLSGEVGDVPLRAGVLFRSNELQLSHGDAATLAALGVTDVVDLREAALRVMHEVYRAFVEEPGARAAYAALFRRIAAARGPLVFHCTAGKDRTGWAAAVLLRLCGVPEETVRADYLRTNDVDGTRAKYLGLVREHLGEEKVEVYEAVMVADLAYLAAADDALAARYGDLQGYLVDGLGLADGEVDALRARLLPG